MPTSNNPPFHAALRLFSVVVIIVLIVGAGLFFAPVLVKPRWPWAVTPFNARFLGAFYTADWTATGTLCWLALFGWIGISGVFKLYAASWYLSSQSAL
ncbi:MAG: hypothetical protein E5X58_02880 [Mesorhizobium sp.]|nr:MAG: hypothetical protein E5X58_02880 [Mesorhizobium sp.]